MSLIVYDQHPGIEYHPDGRRAGHSALHGFTQTEQAQRAAGPKPSVGFGNVTTRRMLESGPPAKHPWLTVALAEEELAIGEYQADRVQCAMDTIA